MKKRLTKYTLIFLMILGVWAKTVSAQTVPAGTTNWLEKYQEKYGNRTQVEQTYAAPETNNAQLTLNVEGTTNTQAITADEQMMVNLVNQERAAKGLQPLEVDMRLVKLAREKANDLIQNNYFDHYSKTLGSPFDQMKRAGVRYYLAGENLAGSGSVERAHKALMESPTHRANILHKRYTHIGVGVIDGGVYGKMFVQHFIEKVVE